MLFQSISSIAVGPIGCVSPVSVSARLRSGPQRSPKRQALLLGLSFNLYRLNHRHLSMRMSTEPDEL
jgi:hypothetical protein